MRVLTISLALVLAAATLLPAALGLAALEPAPRIAAAEPLSPRGAELSRALARRLRAVTRDTVGPAELQASRAEMEALIAAAARALPGLRGAVRVDAGGLAVALSAPLPTPGWIRWLNLDLEVTPSEAGLAVRAVRVGRLDLPPALAVGAARRLLDAATSDDIGSLALDGIAAVRADPETETVHLVVDGLGVGRESLLSRVVHGLREALGLDAGADAEAHYAAMAREAAEGRLPVRGSAAPWLRMAAARVAAADHADPAAAVADLRAAVLALAAHCGSRNIVESISGPLSDAEGRGECGDARLAGRVDLRRHFVLSAALQMAGTSAVSFGLGEVKELIDAGAPKGSGFSFDDLAADRAGARWAEAAMRAAAEGKLAAFAAAMADEAAFMPSVKGLASLMPEAEFERRYRDVESGAYAAELAEIDRRIDALPLHAG